MVRGEGIWTFLTVAWLCRVSLIGRHLTYFFKSKNIHLFDITGIILFRKMLISKLLLCKTQKLKEIKIYISDLYVNKSFLYVKKLYSKILSFFNIKSFFLKEKLINTIEKAILKPNFKYWN